MERRPINLQRRRGRYPSVPFQPAGRIFKTRAGGIPALSGSTPGSAVCDLYFFDGSSLSAATGSYVSETIYNMSSAAVGATKFIQVKYIDGFWFVDVESC